MADNEVIGGISVEITGDYSKLQADIDEAAKVAQQGGQEIAEALNKGASGADALSEAMASVAAGVGTFEEQIELLVNSGATLAEAMKAVEAATQNIGGGLEEVGASAAEAAEQMNLFDEAVSVPYADAAGQLNLFADELEPIPGAATEAAAALVSMSAGAHEAAGSMKEAAPAIEETAKSTGSLVEQLTALGTALAFTAGMVEFGRASLEAADAVGDAAFAMGKLGGSAEQANESVSKLREVAKDAALSFPELLTASNRMTAFLGSSKEVPGIMKAVADSAAVMGTSLSAAAGGFERIIASGDLSQRSLMRLGLTLEDVGKVMGTSADKVADAFKTLDQTQKIEVMTAALGKFSGAAKAMADDSLGAFARLGLQWEEMLEKIGNALEPVIKTLADFASTTILPAIQGLVEAFTSLPEPVQAAAIGVGLLAAAIVPLAGAMAGISAAAGALGTALAPIAGIFGGLVSVVGVGLVSALAAAALGFHDLNAAMAQTNAKYSEMNEKFGKFISDMVTTANTAEKVAEAQTKIKQAMDIGAISAADGAKQLMLLGKAQDEIAKKDLGAVFASFGSGVKIIAEEAPKAATASDGLAIKMGVLRDAVASTHEKFLAAAAKYKETGKGAEEAAKAYDAWQSATGALKSAQDGLLPVVTNVHKATKEFVADFREFPTSAQAAATAQQGMQISMKQANEELGSAQRWLGIVIDRYNQHNATAADVAKAMATVEAAQSKVNKAWAETDKVMEEISKSSLKGFGEAVKKDLAEAGEAIEKLPTSFEKIPPYVRTVSDVMKDLGVKTREVAENQQKLLNAYVELGDHAPTLREEAAAWRNISGAVADLAQTNLPKAMALYEEHYNRMVMAGAKQKELLALEAEGLQIQIRAAEQSGAAATQQIVALEMVRLKQQALYDSTHMWGDLVVGTVRNLEGAFNAVGDAITGALFEGKNFGDAMMGIVKTLAKSIMEDLVNTGLKALKGALLGVNNDLGGLAKTIAGLFGGGGGGGIPMRDMTGTFGVPGFGGVSGIGKGVGGAAGGGTAGGAAGAVSSLTGTATAISGAVSAISGVVSNFQMAGMNKSLDLIVNHTLRIYNDLANLRNDLWEQHHLISDQLENIRSAIGDAAMMTAELLQGIWEAILGRGGALQGAPSGGAPESPKEESEDEKAARSRAEWEALKNEAVQAQYEAAIAAKQTADAQLQATKAAVATGQAQAVAAQQSEVVASNASSAAAAQKAAAISAMSAAESAGGATESVASASESIAVSAEELAVATQGNTEEITAAVNQSAASIVDAIAMGLESVASMVNEGLASVAGALSGVPQFAEGGFVKRNMLAFLHGGEVVVPRADVSRLLPQYRRETVLFQPSASTYSQSTTSSSVGHMSFNIYESNNPRETMRQIAQTMKSLSPKFSAFAR